VVVVPWELIWVDSAAEVVVPWELIWVDSAAEVVVSDLTGAVSVEVEVE
jgi:hypothetical protein